MFVGVCKFFVSVCICVCRCLWVFCSFVGVLSTISDKIKWETRIKILFFFFQSFVNLNNKHAVDPIFSCMFLLQILFC